MSEFEVAEPILNSPFEEAESITGTSAKGRTPESGE